MKLSFTTPCRFGRRTGDDPWKRSVANLSSLLLTILNFGPAHHRRRNLWMAAGVFMGGLSLVAFLGYFHKQNATELELLSRFRAAYAKKCDTPSFAAPLSPMVRDLYLDSSILQTAVDRQASALDHGATCESVAKASFGPQSFRCPRQAAHGLTCRRSICCPRSHALWAG